MFRFFFALFLFVFSLHAKMVDAVAVVIGDADIITLYDITQEMRTAHLSKKEAMEVLIRKKLEAMEIKKRGISVSDEEVYDEIRRLAEANRMSIGDFYDAVLKANGLNSRELKKKIQERLMSQKLYQSIALSKMQEPSEKELREYFALHKSDFEHPSFFDVVIYKAPTQELLLQKLKNPMFFSPSIEESHQRVEYDKLPDALARLLNDTKEGAFTQIVPDGKGEYMMFYMQKRGPASSVDFEQIRPLIVNALMNKKRAEILDDYFAKLKDEVDIKILRE